MAWLLGGCATPMNNPQWQGRISVQVLGDAPSAMSASFSLRGDAHTGELDLYSPLGTTLGALQWTPQHVQLSDGGQAQYFRSLAELTEKATGAALPIDAIFAWFEGRDVQAPGWLADLSTRSQGTFSAKRYAPAPEVTLRIKLDR